MDGRWKYACAAGRGDNDKVGIKDAELAKLKKCKIGSVTKRELAKWRMRESETEKKLPIDVCRQTQMLHQCCHPHAFANCFALSNTTQ